MPLNLLTLEDLQNFKLELLLELKKLFPGETAPQKKLLKSQEVRKLLRISPGTLQNLRSNGTLYSFKVGGIIYYHYEDVEKLFVRKRS
ncbi:MAG: helix-turn-helix domain-containing protein [Ginsengibacter sp.]